MLQHIKKEHILQAAKEFDSSARPNKGPQSQYYVKVGKHKYPFKPLVRLAHEISKSKKDISRFQSSSTTRNMIARKGFRIIDTGKTTITFENSERIEPDYFTKEEIDYFVEIAGKKYSADNPEQGHYSEFFKALRRKVDYWADNIRPEGFKITEDFRWLSGHGKVVTTYLWPRIYHGKDKDVFFNVEINAKDNFAGYKLDGYFRTVNKLSDQKLRLLNSFKKRENISWVKFTLEELLENGSWETLIEKTRTYVARHYDQYFEIKNRLNNDSRYARITHNTNGWHLPSGRDDKGETGTFVEKNGYGFEEWIFDSSRKIEDYLYGFLEPIHKHGSNRLDEVMNLSLYTRDAQQGINLLVADLEDVEVLDKKQAQYAVEVYRKNGWFEEMKDDVKRVNLLPTELEEWIENHPADLFNVRFHKSQLDKILELKTPLTGKGDRLKHYELYHDSAEKKQKIILGKSKFDFNKTGQSNFSPKRKGVRSHRESHEREFTLEHSRLQEAFLKYLQREYGKKSSKVECNAATQTRIDVVRETDQGYIFYEIKVYSSPIISIRNAIGQLLEYSYYLEEKGRASELCIVTNRGLSNQSLEYFQKLKQIITVPLSYIHFDADNLKILNCY